MVAQMNSFNAFAYWSCAAILDGVWLCDFEFSLKSRVLNGEKYQS